MDLRGKKALVTGGSSGIGLGIVAALAEAGAAVAFTYRSEESLRRPKVAALLERHASCYPVMADFTAAFDASNAIDVASSRMGGLDVLVNNAAMFDRNPFLATTRSIFEEILAVNVVAPYELTRRFARRLIDVGMKGSVIHISSLSSTVARRRTRPLVSMSSTLGRQVAS